MSGPNDNFVQELMAIYERAASRFVKSFCIRAAEPIPPESSIAPGPLSFAQVKAAINDLKHDSAKWVGPAFNDAMRQGIKDAIRQAEEAGVNFGEGNVRGQGSFGLMDKGGIETIATATIGDVYKGADSMQGVAFRALNRMADVGIKNGDVNRLVAGADIEGDTSLLLPLRDDLRKIDGGKVTVPTKSGGTMTFDSDYYANLVGDCKLKEAMRLSTHQRLMESGIDLVIVYGTHSMNPCTLLLGKKFSLSGKSPKYPPWSSVAMGQNPYKFGHPHCGKKTRAFVEGLSQEPAPIRGQGYAA